MSLFDHLAGRFRARRKRVRRFVVAEASMSPTLSPGDGVFAVPLRRPKVGQVVVFESPIRPGMWLVKRIAGLAGDEVDVEGRVWPIEDGEMLVLSDNLDVTRADSRTFGPVPVEGAWRMVGRPVRGAGT